MKKAFSSSIVAVLALTSTAFAAGEYKVDVKAPSATKGDKATAVLHVQVQSDFHLNEEYPVKLTVTAPAGVKLEKATMKKEDAAKFKKEGADFNIAFTSSDTGKKDFTGELKFAVCKGTESCKPVTEKISFSVDVK
jgi:Disulphide bond corrector protein DsbC